MEIDEFEQRLHDAEVRLARLKALYEQWFQGIERIEPGIARKELERALDALKREKPRNTALRFRCQQLAARYSTYGIYWGRIAKQIEDGTYRRDVQRARAKAQKEKIGGEKTFELDIEIDGLEGDAFEGMDGFGDSDLDAILGALSAPEPKDPSVTDGPSTGSLAPKTFSRLKETAPRAAAPPARATEPAPPPENAPATQPAPPPAHTVARPGAPAPPRPPAAPLGKPAQTVAPPPLPGAAPGARAPVPAPGAGAPTRVPPPPPVTRAPPPLETPPPSSGSIAIGRMVRPAVPAMGGVREEAGSHSRASRPADGPGSAVMPSAARPAARPAASARPTPAAATPAAATPAAAAPRSAGSASGARPMPGGAAASNGAAPDMRALYDRYVDARRKNNERVDNVRLESLQQSVEKMLPKLREKHGNKAIDFEVVLQDGKVGLKPKVRG